MLKKLALLSCLLFGIANFSLPSASALDPNSVASIFTRLSSNKELANPSVVVIDEKTGEVVFEKNAYSPRKPASVQKILSAAAALTYLQPTQRFTTSAWVGVEPKSIVIQGELDPWFSLNDTQAKKMGRTSLPRIEYNSLSALKRENSGSIRNSTIYYSNLYSQDVANLKSFYQKHGVVPKMVRVDSETAYGLAESQILQSQSPELQEILAFTLTWSDNLLAERIARLASRAAGHSLDDAGVAETFAEILASYQIDSTKLAVQDASGLSRDNKVTATQIGRLLIAIKKDPKFLPLIDGLPVAGVTGTLRHRFIETAPSAIGLIKAKTGTLNGTANLAGYVESDDRIYVFVIIADQLKRSYTAENRARATVDRILGKIAAPYFPELLPVQSEVVTSNT